MKSIMFAAIAALAVATPATAHTVLDNGVHAELTAGVEDFNTFRDKTDVNYNAELGLTTVAAGGHLIIGVAATSDNVFDSDRSFGVEASVDTPILKNLYLGVEASVDNVFRENNREYGVAGRVSYVAKPGFVVYGKAGYSDLRGSDFINREELKHLDGLQLTAGTQVNVTKHTYVKAEYTHTDYQYGVNRQSALVGVGIRF